MSPHTQRTAPARLPCICCPPWERRHAATTARPNAAGARAATGKSGDSATGVPLKPVSIDVHHHISPRAYVDAVGAENLVNSYPASRKAAYEWTPEVSLEDMDRGGTATAITSVWNGTHIARTANPRKLARECNEFAANMVRDYPGRFGMFAAIPLPDVEGSLLEIEYALDVLKADGVHMMTSYSDQWLGDPLYAPVFDELNRRKAVLYTHPVVAEMTRNVISDVPDTLIEIGTDTTRAIAGVLFSGTAARCPDLRIIWSHAGGTLLPVIERFIRLAQRPQFAARLPKGILHELTRFYYDVAQVAHPVPMAALREMVPLSQILFGTDYAFRSAAEINEGLAQCGLAARQLRAIRRDNALPLFPRLG